MAIKWLSTVTSKSSINKVTALFDKSFVINSGGQNYTPPTINSSDQVSGEFLNDGPRNSTVRCRKQMLLLIFKA